MDRIRYRRLEDFERKRMERKKEESKHPDEHSKLYKVFDTGNDAHRTMRHDPTTDKMVGKISPILKKPKDPTPTAKPIEQDVRLRTISPPKVAAPNRDIIPSAFPNFELSSPIVQPVCDDYESSTAISSSSREGDFDDIDFCKLPVIGDHKSDVFAPTIDIQQKETSSKLSWLTRIFGKKAPKQAKKIVKSDPDPRELHIDDKISTVSLLKFFLIESRVVWRQLLSDHAAEWEETKLIRNKCIADLITIMNH